MTKNKNTKSNRARVEVVVTDSTGHRRATAPVLELAPLRLHIRKILVPVDFSEPSQKALQYARSFAEQCGAEVTLLHVVEPVIYPAELGYVPIETVETEKARIKAVRDQLQQLAGQFGPAVKAQIKVRSGRGWSEIVEEAKSSPADLIVIATHGYTGLKHVLLGSTSERVVRHAPCPVLTVREREHDFV
jgi:nucleotide-binding universal stress UspA family protein